MLCASHGSRAQNGPTPQPEPVPVTPAQADQVTTEQWAIHGQSTFTWQLQPGFRSAFSGPQSLPADANGRQTWDATVYLGFRPWQGGEIWFNPEVDQGFGLGNSLGVAGYLSGEAYKLGQADPYYRMAKAFFRQTIDLGGETQKLDPDLNQLGGTQTANRVVLTAGKISVVDIFDTNKYAHDPRGDFLNWAILDVGSFDYAADAWGATYGAAAEWYQDRYAARVGLFDLSSVPNSTALSLPLLHQTQFVAELEERHTLGDQPGKIKVTYWLSRGNLGTYTDALALASATGTTPSTAAVRDYRSKYGVGFNLEQQIIPDLGLFVKGGWSQGGVEEVDFTDINASIATGLALAGTRWGRPDDTVGACGSDQRDFGSRQPLPCRGRPGRHHRRRRAVQIRSRGDPGDLLQFRGVQLGQGHRGLPVRQQPGLQPAARPGLGICAAVARGVLSNRRSVSAEPSRWTTSPVDDQPGARRLKAVSPPRRWSTAAAPRKRPARSAPWSIRRWRHRAH